MLRILDKYDKTRHSGYTLAEMLIVLVILYVLSPVDLMPLNCVDDLIVVLLGYAAQKRIGVVEE